MAEIGICEYCKKHFEISDKRYSWEKNTVCFPCFYSFLKSSINQDKPITKLSRYELLDFD